MAVDALIGLQRGDEGKGRVADFLAADYEIVARGNGGANAGHTFVPEGATEPFVTNLLPSGIAHKGVMNVLGQGVYVDPDRLREEIELGRNNGYDISRRNLVVSNIAHLVMPHHLLLDRIREDTGMGNGSTRKGIAQVAEEKYFRQGVRVEEVMDATMAENTERAFDSLRKARERMSEVFEEIETQQMAESAITREQLERTKEMTDRANADNWASAVAYLREDGYFVDTRQLLLENLQAGRNVLAEGAQSHWLDINNGLYPNVTSSHTTVLGLLDGLGVGPKQLGTTIGVAKLINSHVGDGIFKTEVEDPELAEYLRGDQGSIDYEQGATTQRKRRMGYLDLVQINTASVINDVDRIVVNKVDPFPRYGTKAGVCTAYRYGGKHREIAPSSVKEFAQARPVYDLFDTWSNDIQWVRKYDSLPDQAKFLLESIEIYVGKVISHFGVGPHHDQLIPR